MASRDYHKVNVTTLGDGMHCPLWFHAQLVYVASARNFTWRMENLLFYLDYHMNGREDHKESKSSEAFIK